jgi:hypothetical protein
MLTNLQIKMSTYSRRQLQRDNADNYNRAKLNIQTFLEQNWSQKYQGSI